MRAFLLAMLVVAVAVGFPVAGCSGDDSSEDERSEDDGGSSNDGGHSSTGDPPVDAPAGLWVRSIESVGDEGVIALSPRPDGSFVLLGTYHGPGTFNPGQSDEMVLAMPDGASEQVLAHYASDGSLRSLRADPLGTGSGRPYMTADGSMYVTGTGEFAAGSVMASPDADVFVAKYDPEGTPLWASSASGAAGMGAGTAIDVMPDGSVVIAGTLDGTITFGIGEPNETRLASTGEEIFLARYAADGGLLWAKRAITAPYMPTWSLEAAADGGIFFYGSLKNTTTFNPGLGDETRLEGGNIGFVVKLDDAGEVLWAREFSQAEGMNGVTSLASYPDGSLVVTGSFHRILTLGLGERGETTLAADGSEYPGRTQFPDFFAARLDARGELVWARREGGGVWDQGSQVEPLEDGAALLAGGYTNTVTFAADEPSETTLTTDANDTTPFVAVINRDGSLRWVREGVAGQVAPLADGSVAIAGAFMGTLTIFPDEVGGTTLASAGRWDVYVARLGWE